MTRLNGIIQFLIMGIIITIPFLLPSAPSSAMGKSQTEETHILPSSIPAPSPSPFSEPITADILNFSVLSNTGNLIYRGGLPDAVQMTALKSAGMRSDLSLLYTGLKLPPSLTTAEIEITTERSKEQEEETLVKTLELNFFNISILPIPAPTDDEVNLAVSIINDPKNWPIYVHCDLGEDRTGYIIAAYRVKIQHWTAEEAWNEYASFHINLPQWESDFFRYAHTISPSGPVSGGNWFYRGAEKVLDWVF